MKKVKLGVALLVSGWFINVGGISGSTNKECAALGELIQQEADEVIGVLKECFDVVSPGMVYSIETAEKAVNEFRTSGIDAIAPVFLVWNDDFPLIKLLSAFGSLPTLVWCYNPYEKLPDNLSMDDLFRATGSVGALQGSAPMSKMDLEFEFCLGSPREPDVKKTLSDFSKSVSLKKSLEKCRIGQLNPRCESMTGTFVDEFKLLQTFGVESVPLTSYRLSQEAACIPEKAISDYLTWLKSLYRVVDVPDESLYYAARATLAAEKIIIDEDLDILSIEDLNAEMHSLLKTRPCLWTETMTERNSVVVMEGDSVSGLGSWICSELSGAPCMFGEIFTFSSTENAILVGHAGMHDPRLAGKNEITIIKDMEYYQSDETTGAWMNFSAEPGEVMIVSTFSDKDDYRFITYRGKIMEDEGKMKSGFPHAFIKCEDNIKNIYETLINYGVTQHFSVCRQDISGTLELFCKLTGNQYIAL